MSNPKFMYKGYDVNTIISSGSSSVNTGITTPAYSGFPSYNPSNTNVDLDKVKNPLLFEISSSDVVSRSNIQAASYKTVNTNGSYPIPAWCNGVKFYISTAKGSSGTAGNKGDTGAQGPQGPKGPDGTAKSCPVPKTTRPKGGGPGGPGGPGGDGGPGGAAGVGGEGVYFYNTSLIPVTAGSSVIIDTTTNMSLKISDSNYSANKGGSGNDGSKGKQGDTGGPGGPGGPGKNDCNAPGTGSPGNTGSKGATGNKGASGNNGSGGSVSSPNTVTQGTNTTDSKEITIYFFAT
jgi:hypothetical protein